MFYQKTNTKDNPNRELPIRIVSATRGKIEEFNDTLLGKTISTLSCVHNFEIFVEAENKESIGKIYNQAIEMSRDNPAILVFVHDDVLITDLHWHKTIRAGLEKFDIIGLAGNVRRHPKQPSWYVIDENLSIIEKEEYLSGVVSHGESFPPNNVGVFGEIGKKCKLLDGLFLAVDSRTLINNNLRFDPRFVFHFYDLDFCRQAELLNLTMGTVPITVVHGGRGQYDDHWKSMYAEYLDKWEQ